MSCCTCPGQGHARAGGGRDAALSPHSPPRHCWRCRCHRTLCQLSPPGPVAGRPRQAVPGGPGGAQPNPTKRCPGKHSSRDNNGITAGTVPLSACHPQSRLALPVPLTLPCWHRGSSAACTPSQARKGGTHSPVTPAAPRSPQSQSSGCGGMWQGQQSASCPLLFHSGWSQSTGGSGELPVSRVTVPEPVGAQLSAPPG